MWFEERVTSNRISGGVYCVVSGLSAILGTLIYSERDPKHCVAQNSDQADAVMFQTMYNLFVFFFSYGVITAVCVPRKCFLVPLAVYPLSLMLTQWQFHRLTSEDTILGIVRSFKHHEQYATCDVFFLLNFIVSVGVMAAAIVHFASFFVDKLTSATPTNKPFWAYPILFFEWLYC